MNAAIAPGVIPALAPPAAEGPSPSTGQPVTGKPFADTVAEHRAAQDAAAAAREAAPKAEPPEAPQAASAPNAPPGEPTAEATPADAGLLELVQDLLNEARTQESSTTVPTLDRPAGAGDTETDAVDVHAMEALMAQSLIVRTPVQPETTTEPVAPSAVADVAGTTDATALAELQQAIAEVAGLSTADGTQEAAVAADVASFAALVQDGSDATPDVPEAAPAAVATAAAESAEGDPADLLQAQPQALSATGDDVVMTATPQPKADTTGEAAASIAGDVEVTTADVSTAASTTGELPGVDGAEQQPKRAGADATSAAATAATAANAPASSQDTLAPVQGAAVRTEVATGGAVTSQIANTVQSAVLRGEHEVRLVLNPPELGRVEVQITETPGGIRVHMLADQPASRDLIERQLPLLQQALAARDVRVERMEVGRSGDANASQAWSNSQGSNDGQRQRGQQDGGSPDWSPLAAMGLGITDAARAERPKVAATSGLDVMA